MGYLDMSGAAYRRDGLGADDSMTVDPAMAYSAQSYIEWLAKIEVYTESGGGGGGEKYFFHADYLGSVRMISDVNGEVVWQKRYTPFGSEEEQSGSIVNDYRFTGKAWDAEAGLFYFNARWYDPETGRFISEDPLWGNIRDPQSLNRFRYARNNPFRFSDPTGLYDDQDNDGDTEMFGDPPNDGNNNGGSSGGSEGPTVIASEKGTGSKPTEKGAQFYLFDYDMNKLFGPYIGSTYPDDPNKCATIDNVFVAYEVVNHPKYGKSLFLDKVPTYGINPAHPPDKWADEMFVHQGYDTWNGSPGKGSCGCPTVDNDDWDEFIGNFDIGDRGWFGVIR